MKKIKSFLIRFSIPVCVSITMIVQVAFAIARQEALLPQYNLYILGLILIVSVIFALKRQERTTDSDSNSY